MARLSRKAKARQANRKQKARDLAKNEEGILLGKLGIKQLVGNLSFSEINLLDRGSTPSQMKGVRARQEEITRRIDSLNYAIGNRYGISHNESGKPDRNRPIWEAAKRETIRTKIPLVIVTPSRLARNETFTIRNKENDLPTKEHLEKLLKGIPRELIFTMSSPNLELDKDRNFLVSLEKRKGRGSPESASTLEIARQLHEEGLSNRAIARQLGVSEFAVRYWLKNS